MQDNHTTSVSPRRIITCAECGRERPHQAFGLCGKCYMGHRRIEHPEIVERDRVYGIQWRSDNRDKKRMSDKRWRTNNPERCKINRNRWIDENTERYNDAIVKWQKEHPDNIRASKKKYDDAHPELRRIITWRYNTRKKLLPATLTLEQWEAIKRFYNNCCAYCGRKFVKLTQDHLIPVSKGGPYTAQNIVPACRSCNSKKYNNGPLKPVQPLLF